jgi:hypothetical protein
MKHKFSVFQVSGVCNAVSPPILYGYIDLPQNSVFTSSTTLSVTLRKSERGKTTVPFSTHCLAAKSKREQM